MKFVVNSNFEKMVTTYRLEISHEDIMNLRLRQWDSVLFRECAGSDKISDKLLALETLTKRIEEQS